MRIKLENREIDAKLLGDWRQKENYLDHMIIEALFDIEEAGKTAQAFVNNLELFNCRIFPYGTDNIKIKNNKTIFTTAILIGEP